MNKRRDNQKQIALNTHLILCLILFIAFLGLSISCAVESKIAMSFMFAVFTLLPIFVFAISPLYFIFSADDVVIVYNFRQRETIKWDFVRSIYQSGSWIGTGGLPHYVFEYPRKEKRLFFIVGEIPKNATTTTLIKKYCKKKIQYRI